MPDHARHGAEMGKRPPLDPRSAARHKPLMQDEAASSETIGALSFEEALKRLEAIVHRLESGDASLDESIALYGEGDRLRAQCEARLKSAEARIERIVSGADGRPAGTRPFDAA